ncbi:hypothetical protein E6R60_26725 [Streptomyces sp. A0642]|uniref:hypothetical protein n=1 Tax=Streptomyces sp. A0642 TaxID=2563100 RepID=UPI0010A29401|nr:hypothetical protein [Streptomyces sp. A0642]THA72525.1 hypothetical protein E6R60_26725 [Streptomyces sp. A0642]
MRNVARTTVLAAVVACSAVLLTACEGVESAAPSAPVTVTASPSVAATPSPSPSEQSPNEAMDEAQKENEKARKELQDKIDAAASAGAMKAKLPDFTGQILQTAQDGAQAAGFYILGSDDATGAGRMQVWDRNWVVCSQTPGAGSYDVETRVVFHTVKDSESC